MPLGLQERWRKTDRRRDGSSRAWTGEGETREEQARNRRDFWCFDTHTRRGALEYSSRTTEPKKEGSERRELIRDRFACAGGYRLGFGTSRRKASARGGESPEALAWLPPALSWITLASPVCTQCYCTRAAPRFEPVATFEEKAVAVAVMLHRRRRWLPRKRDTHGRHAPASMILVAREKRGREVKRLLSASRNNYKFFQHG